MVNRIIVVSYRKILTENLDLGVYLLDSSIVFVDKFVEARLVFKMSIMFLNPGQF